MRFLLATFCVASLIAASDAGASIYTYHYQGYELMEVPNQYCHNGVCYNYKHSFSGILRIDESLLPDGTLVNADVFWVTDVHTSWWDDPWPHAPNRPAFVLALTVSHYPPTAYGSFRFKTDADRNMTSWGFEFADGPPDISISSRRDMISHGGGVYTAPPGVWALGKTPVLPHDPRVPAPIPLPAPAMLLLAACGALLGFRRRPA